MPIERFTRKDFEAALPFGDDGKPLWKHDGLVHKEYEYSIELSPNTIVKIRSSVGENEVARECGENSIRIWLCDEAERPIGVKLSKYITRSKGWETRFQKQLKTVLNLGKLLCECRKCKNTKGRPKLRRVNKDGDTKGLLFINCDCGHFEWLYFQTRKYRKIFQVHREY